MDIAYDHIQSESFSPSDEPHNPPWGTNDSNSEDPENKPSGATASASAGDTAASPSLNVEFQQAFTAVSASPWGSAIGGWWNQARRQGETIYQDLQKEATETREQALQGFSSLREQVVSRTRALSLHGEPGPLSSVPGEEAVPRTSGTAEAEGKDDAQQQEQRPESLPADIAKEAGTLVASLRLTAASRLKDLQRAEDAADEALLQFGMNVRNFLRDAVTISAPAAENGGEPTEVLFETQDAGTGRKVFHSSRFDAQLHAIHTTAASFTQDPADNESWATWETQFDIEGQTGAIAGDLEKYEELRRAMEKLVPEKVEYRSFWKRYYFLRKAIEEEERRRREVLKGATTNPEEEVSWDDDEDDDGNAATTAGTVASNKAASESTTTLSAPAPGASTLKPTSPRRSHEDESKSVADSDASYDIVSGATSRAAGSPKEEKRSKDDESDDDWE